MKFKLVLISLGVMILCFFISSMFVVNSGIISEDCRIDEFRFVEILRALDEVPFVNIDAEDVVFYDYGEIVEINDGLVVRNYLGDVSFDYDGEVSDLKVGDEVVVTYNYSLRGEKVAVEIRKIIKA